MRLIVADGRPSQPERLVSIRCAACRRRIYLDSADEYLRDEDEASDELTDED